MTLSICKGIVYLELTQWGVYKHLRIWQRFVRSCAKKHITQVDRKCVIVDTQCVLSMYVFQTHEHTHTTKTHPRTCVHTHDHTHKFTHKFTNTHI